jgi:hypothetical protein
VINKEVILSNCATKAIIHISLPVLVSGDINLLTGNFLELDESTAIASVSDLLYHCQLLAFTNNIYLYIEYNKNK